MRPAGELPVTLAAPGMLTVDPTAPGTGADDPPAAGGVAPTGEFSLVELPAGLLGTGVPPTGEFSLVDSAGVVAAGVVAAGVVAETRVEETAYELDDTTVLRAGQSVTSAAQEVMVSYCVL